jgi:hypothetical protein
MHRSTWAAGLSALALALWGPAQAQPEARDIWLARPNVGKGRPNRYPLCRPGVSASNARLNRGLLATVFGAAVLSMVAVLSVNAYAQQLWFAPPDSFQRGDRPPTNRDFPQLFDASPAWSAKADVFLISPFLGSVSGPEDTLRKINAFVAQHHMALAVGIHAAEMDNANPVPGECGYGVEGLNRPNRNAINFKRLKSLGIDVAYVSMDEPLTFAHYYDRKNACHYSITDTARRVAASLAEIRQFYPNVKVVDVEAPGITSAQQWNTDFPVWLAAYRQATGRPLDAVVFDVDWRQPWLNWVSPSLATGRHQGVSAGIILDATGPGASDADSIAARKQNAQSVANSGLTFDLVEIANWTPHPSRNLPESDPDTLTSFLHWYEVRHAQRDH